ncbi:MAG: hypothetical protein PHT99_04445 [Methanoregula sp.]|nr:hypothetical protein [Methanoregula sp.]
MRQTIIIATILVVLSTSLMVAGCTGTTGMTTATAAGAAADGVSAQTSSQANTAPPPGGSLPGGNFTPSSGGMGPGGSPPDGMRPDGNSTTSSGGMGPGGVPPGGMMSGGNSSSSSGGIGPGGAPGGSSPGASSYTFSGMYTLNGSSASETDGLYTSETQDISAVYVTDGGNLNLVNPTIVTSGETSSNDASSFYGLNAAVLANDGSTVTITGGSISSSGSGANGAFPTGTGSTIILTDVDISATGGGGHGVMATNGGILTLTDVDITTTGANGAPLATDRGSGMVTATRGIVFASGRDSPGIYSTGIITVTDSIVTTTGSEAAVIEGFNSIILKNTTLTGGVEKTGGSMIYQSMSGDADAGTGTFTMTGGSYTSTAGPAFFVTNTNAVITLTGVKVTSNSATLIKAAGTDRWGTSGSNGGAVTFTADGEALTGSLVTDSISSIDATLKNNSSLTGSINSAALTLDATSTWTVTGDSALTSLSDSRGISGTTITNIYGNGHMVTYDPGLAANSALGGQTYSLANGGTLTPT